MGGVVKITPKGGAGPQNANYITRRSAAEEGEVAYHNAPEEVEAAETWEEMRIRLRSWAEQVQMEERARHGNRAGQARTHYRVVLSYEEEIEAGAAKEDAKEWLEEEFPKAQAVGIVHQDTDHTHVHVWMSARKLSEKKVHISKQDLKDVHAAFDAIYEQRMQVQSRNADKIEETRQFQRRYAELKAETVSEKELREWAEANRPERATPPGPKVYRERDERRLAQGAAREAENGRTWREAMVKGRMKRKNSRVERLRKDIDRKKEHLEQVKQELEEQKPEHSHERDQRRSARDEPGAGGGAREAESGKRASERANYGEGGRGGEGGDLHGGKRAAVGDERASSERRSGGEEDLGGEEGGRDRNGQSEGSDREQHGAGSSELVGGVSSRFSGGDRGAGSRQGADRGDELDGDGSADRGGGPGGGGSSPGGPLEGGEVEGGEAEEGGDPKGWGSELEMSDRQEMIRNKVDRLARLTGRRTTGQRSQSRKQEIRQVKERLLLDLDDPVYREAAEGKESIPRELVEIADHLRAKDEQKAQIFGKSWNYVAEARRRGKNPVEALRKGWSPGSEAQSEGQAKDQGQDRSQSQSRDRSRGRGGRGR
jgi:hypothetical protein